MEIELEGRAKPLSYKVKATSRESPTQKASLVLDSDLRTHWSTATNTKEWILLELNEPCLLSHIRIHNKSVLEWEISVGLRYKPETFVKVRPRCEAPRRDVVYPMNYAPCRYARISCLRGNPIAIFFIQLIGVSVVGLEPEFQPVVNHLLPHIMSHKQDACDIHLQLLKDITSRLHGFLPQLEADLSSFSDAAEANLHFLAMLAGPFYPILFAVNERASTKCSGSVSDAEVTKNSPPSSALTVSSNFAPLRSRSTSPFLISTSSSLVFRPDAIFMLLRKAYKDVDLGTVCRTASRILQKLLEPVTVQVSLPLSEVTSGSGDESSNSELLNPVTLLDYSKLFGEEFQLPDDQWDCSYLNVVDLGAVEEGILHVLFACASQPSLCNKLTGKSSNLWSALPLIQALLPALRPLVGSPSDMVDDNFSLWKQNIVQQALNQIVVTSTSSLYCQVLHACAGYLASFSPSHAKAASILIDLCSSVLAPWVTHMVAKVDLAVELLEDLLGVIQGAKQLLPRARAALKYILLAISGHMDDILEKYKESKHRILFLVEMLEPSIDPAIASFKSTIPFGDLSSVYPEKQERNCVIALNVIRTAVQKPAVLPSLESEWRRGSVAPSVLLAILEPRIPMDFDLRTSPISEPSEIESSSDLRKSLDKSLFSAGFYCIAAHDKRPSSEAVSSSSTSSHVIASLKQSSQDELDGKLDVTDTTLRTDVFEDASLLFAPAELRNVALTSLCNDINELNSVSSNKIVNSEPKLEVEKSFPSKFPVNLLLDTGFTAEYFNLQADYFQLKNFQDCEFQASEFHRLAMDLHSQDEITVEGHDAAIDALLLASECYVNPFFMMSSETSAKLMSSVNMKKSGIPKESNSGLRSVTRKYRSDLETIAQLEKDRDRIVLQILLEAAELDRKYQEKVSNGEQGSCYAGISEEQVVKLSLFDAPSADATTLVRQNQSLLCNFIVDRLRRECHSMHEVLIQSLVFLLHSATKLCCSPEHVIDIVLQSAEYLNEMLTSLYHQFKEGNLYLEPEAVHGNGIKRRWILLQRLVIASSSGSEGAEFAIIKNNGFSYTELIPPSAWINRISAFSGSKYPLVRFLGWMAISRNARQYIKDRTFLASDLQQLTYLLSIFADELAVVDNVVNRGHIMKLTESDGNHVSIASKSSEVSGQQHENESLRFFHVIYPDLYKFFPNMRKQFGDFGETILEAVGLQLRSLPSTIVPDILCWFSELCLWSFSNVDRMGSQNGPHSLKGYVAKNAKVVILFILEAIITEHMEAMVPEIPRIVQVLTSLCRASYCDVLFLDSVLSLLKPIISYSLSKVSDEERLLHDDLCLNFESLCFNELFNNIKPSETPDGASEETCSRGLTIFILASVFPDLSIQRRKEMLQSLLSWADFTATEPTSSFYDYLFAFNNVMQSCKHLLLRTLQLFGATPLQPSSGEHTDNSSKLHLSFLRDVYCYPSDKVHDKLEVDSDAVASSSKNIHHLAQVELEEFSKDLEALITKLHSTVELCWKLHPQLATKLTILAAECFIYSRCLSSIAQKNVDFAEDNDGSSNVQNIDTAEAHDSKTSASKSVEQILVHWRIGLEGISETILSLQEKSCWEVASVTLDCLLEAPHCFSLRNVINLVCSAIKNNSYGAPKITWRLRTDKWLSILLARGIHALHECESSVADLFRTLLGHPEPEQRFIALWLLGKLIGQNMNGGTDIQDFSICNNLFSPSDSTSIPESVITILVSSTWDLLVVMASSDVSFHLRRYAMALLVHFIPFAQRRQLQSFMAAADSVNSLGKLGQCEGPLLRLSLALISGACLYSPPEDISLIPQNVWRDIEALGSSKSESRTGDLEKKACQILCRLKNEEGDAKELAEQGCMQALKVLSARPSKQISPDFTSTREAILQVMANLTSSESYFDFFSDKVDKAAMELEEAEIELDILQKEHAPQQSKKDSKGSPVKDDSRLLQIKESICSLEKSKLREDIAMRRQKKLLLRHTRQKDLEEAAVKEAELLRTLDRERAAESEKEIERQRLLELERAKTRELRHALDIEKERQTQRELQRELEQAESGVRLTRRDFSSSTQSRPRDRYRERENGRPGIEGSTRNVQLETANTSSSTVTGPGVVLSGSRPFTGQHPTILQSRDRTDDCGSSYEENFEGISKDSGDTGSVGDPDLASAFDGSVGEFGSGQKHGPRGGKSRQVVERRERDGRREGKWERKHS